VTLTVGDEEWPLPIPLVKADGGWQFDTDAGDDEILSRRIGRNELSTIQVCLAIVDAQREYAEMNVDGSGPGQYAQRFLSQPDKHDGLYWPTAEGAEPSPLGELVSAAAEEGYDVSPPPTEAPRPYHGYLYRILKSQGPDARGGAQDYLDSGRMTRGFGVVAFPADYGNSGIKTFLVDQDGIVYQRDLGADTERIASAMTAFNPDSSWDVVDEDDNPESDQATKAP
jgi:hypothetical protein